MDESSPSAVNLINFLQFEFEKNGKQYRTINTYRSAVSATLGTCPVCGVPVGQDPLVCRFMRGLLRLIPPRTKLFPTWDLVTVLNRLVSWGDVTQLSLLQLLKKTAFLVAVVCYKRPADLCNMQVVPDYWQLDESGFTCQPLGFGKTVPFQSKPLPSSTLGQPGEEVSYAQTAVSEAVLDHIQTPIQGYLNRYDEQVATGRDT